MNDKMNLEEMLEDLSVQTNEDSLITVASTEVKVTKLEGSESLTSEEDDSSSTPREIAFKLLEKYESKVREINDINNKIKEIQNKIEETCPELFKEIKILEGELAKKNVVLDGIKSEATPIFRKVAENDIEDKTLIYGKVQATYVFATEKHQFDLKTFIEEQNDFYLDNLSYFDAYSTITPVSDYVKFTVKKK